MAPAREPIGQPDLGPRMESITFNFSIGILEKLKPWNDIRIYFDVISSYIKLPRYHLLESRTHLKPWGIMQALGKVVKVTSHASIVFIYQHLASGLLSYKERIHPACRLSPQVVVISLYDYQMCCIAIHLHSYPSMPRRIDGLASNYCHREDV